MATTIYEYDPSRSWKAGDVIRYWGKYFRANRDISPPFLSFMAEKPDESDAWTEVSSTSVIYGGGGGGGHHGGGHGGHGGGHWHGGGSWGALRQGILPSEYDEIEDLVECAEWDPEGNCLRFRRAPAAAIVRTVDVLGAFDIGYEQKKMNSLDKVPVSVGRILLKSGQWAIDHAKSVAESKNSILTGPMPGGAARDKVAAALAVHQVALANLTDPNAMYAGASDLKKNTMQAFIEANAADEGAATIEQNWNKMWDDVGEAIKNLPAEVRKQMGNAIEWLTGVPLWVLTAGGVALLGLAGFVAWKLVRSDIGKQAIGTYVGTRFGKR